MTYVSKFIRQMQLIFEQKTADFDHENNVENQKCFNNIKGDFYTSFQIMLISKRG